MLSASQWSSGATVESSSRSRKKRTSCSRPRAQVDRRRQGSWSGPGRRARVWSIAGLARAAVSSRFWRRASGEGRTRLTEPRGRNALRICLVARIGSKVNPRGSLSAPQEKRSTSTLVCLVVPGWVSDRTAKRVSGLGACMRTHVLRTIALRSPATFGYG